MNGNDPGTSNPVRPSGQYRLLEKVCKGLKVKEKNIRYTLLSFPSMCWLISSALFLLILTYKLPHYYYCTTTCKLVLNISTDFNCSGLLSVASIPNCHHYNNLTYKLEQTFNTIAIQTF